MHVQSGAGLMVTHRRTLVITHFARDTRFAPRVRSAAPARRGRVTRAARSGPEHRTRRVTEDFRRHNWMSHTSGLVCAARGRLLATLDL